MKTDSSQSSDKEIIKLRPPRALTRRQQLFIAAYLKHFNSSRAAREAGYSQKTAYSIGHENRHKPAIKAVIDAELARQHQEWEANFLRKQQQGHGFARR